MTLTRPLFVALAMSLTLAACGKSDKAADTAASMKERATQAVEQAKDAAADAGAAIAEEAEKAKKAAEEAAAAPAK